MAQMVAFFHNRIGRGVKLYSLKVVLHGGVRLLREHWQTVEIEPDFDFPQVETAKPMRRLILSKSAVTDVSADIPGQILIRQKRA